ncbi:MAG: hypothetical protein HUU10_01225 [Bacteroidetes bacterium]|nr:hypothetical protein [Bacteroidota bacterium]
MTQRTIHSGMTRFLFIALCLFTGSTTGFSQDLFTQKATSTGNIGVSFSNTGVFGNAFNANFQKGMPSLEYPLGSGIEHIFEGGLWVGARVGSEARVSTAAAGEDANGYGAGDEGYEFTVDTINTQIVERSSLQDSRFASPLAISHQDFVTWYTDRRVTIPGPNTPITNHTKPIGLAVRQESYAWSFAFTDFFVIVTYHITNESADTLRDVYTGIWTDFVVRNVKVTAPRGSAFFSAHGNGVIDSLASQYAFDANGDIGFTDSYVALSYLGTFYQNQLINRKTDPGHKLNYQYWGFRGADPASLSPINDAERYLRMSTSMTEADIQVKYTKAGNRSAMMAAGPLASVAPGESFEVVFAIVCAKKTGFEAAALDKPEQKVDLITNIGWARSTFQGEDVNNNGVLDPGEDANNNGILNRYIVPTPPNSPRIKVVPGDRMVSLYWTKASEQSVDPISNLRDFEGYRIFKTDLGDELDLTRSLNDQLKLVAQFDLAGNPWGFNTGLETSGAFSNLTASPVTFEGDTTRYHYRYDFPGLKNGWMYNFAVTAFDRGDEVKRIPPLESPVRASSLPAFPGTMPNEKFVNGDPFVYPNPFYVKARWDGAGDVNHRIQFANLPSKATVTIFTISGDKVFSFDHDGTPDSGNRTKWFDTFGARTSGNWQATFTGGEYGWNLVSTGNQNIASGLYLFTVEDKDSGDVKTGKFVIIN